MINLEKAKVKRRIAKNKFDCDLTSVDTIYWAYKLSKDTVSVGNANDTSELEIFDVKFKDKVDTKVFSKIQTAIPYRILFRYVKNNQTQYSMYIGKLITTDKTLIENKCLNIDAMSINSLIENLVEFMIDKARKDGETIDDYIARCDTISSLERDIASIKKQRDNEKQPNKKIQLNNELKEKLRQLKLLENYT